MVDDTPNGLLLFGICFGVLLLFVLLLWAINVLPGKVRGWWAALTMSSIGARSADREAGDNQVSHPASEAGFVSAEPNTDDTERVPDATGAESVDTSARDIIRASLIAELLDSGLLTNRDKTICQAFRCSKAASTRPEAPFQVALRLVEQHRAKAHPEYVGDMIERVHREVAQEMRGVDITKGGRTS